MPDLAIMPCLGGQPDRGLDPCEKLRELWQHTLVTQVKVLHTERMHKLPQRTNPYTENGRNIAKGVEVGRLSQCPETNVELSNRCMLSQLCHGFSHGFGLRPSEQAHLVPIPSDNSWGLMYAKS